MNEKEKELNEVLEELAKNLDITDTEDAAIRESYNAVGEFLAKEGTLLDKYEVEIFRPVRLNTPYQLAIR